MKYKQVIFSGHAIRQMFYRAIGKDDILNVIENGQVITDYPQDRPYPSFLILGFADNRPIHIVIAIDNENQTAIVITAYIPDAGLWTSDFKSRR
jgi:hypothetical protein